MSKMTGKKKKAIIAWLESHRNMKRADSISAVRNASDYQLQRWAAEEALKDFKISE